MGHHRELGHHVDRRQLAASGAAGAASPDEIDEPSYSGSDVNRRTYLLLEREDFQITLASAPRRVSSDALIERMYSWRGYKAIAEGGTQRATRAVTLQACNGEDVFGTLNVAVDDVGGLASDALYKTEIDAFRRSGAVVSEFTRLAIESEYGSKELLGGLFHVGYLFAAELGGATDIFIEVNPRHVVFYKRMLNFTEAGECRICPRVDAPAVLLHLPVPYVREQVKRYAGRGGHRARSLYSYFCASDEEASLIRRIRALAADPETCIGQPMTSGRLYGTDAAMPVDPALRNR